MEFSAVVNWRYSVRAYKSDPVEEYKLQRILETVHLAPSAANRQPIGLIVIHTAGREHELRRIYHREWFVQAPIIMAVCAIPLHSWVRSDGTNYAYVDAAIAMDHLILAAANEGLGTCWVAAFDVVAAREVLHLPEGIEPVAFTPLGYAADSHRTKERKPLLELVHYDRW